MEKRLILLVEDEMLIRAIVAESLGDAGFEVVEAANGDEALALIGRLERVDLLLTDMQMPGKADGNAVAACARHHFPRLPVIYVTGRPDSLTNPVGGNDLVICKPFGPKEVIGAAVRLLAELGQHPAVPPGREPLPETLRDRACRAGPPRREDELAVAARPDRPG